MKKVREPHPFIGCWWTLYDYGLDTVKTWEKDYVHPYPGPHLANSVKYVDLFRCYPSWEGPATTLLSVPAELITINESSQQNKA